MTIDEIRKYHRAEPFRPFHLILADGRKLLVKSPEKIGLSPGGRSLGVYSQGDTLDLLEIDNVVAVRPTKSRTPRKRTQ